MRPDLGKALLVVLLSLVLFLVGGYLNVQADLESSPVPHGVFVALWALQALSAVGVVGGLVWLFVSHVRTPPSG